MDDLVTWLRAQLDEDRETAQVADALTRSPWASRVARDSGGYNEGKIVDGDGFAVVHVEDQTPERAVAEHIARWDPARVLAEVDAKRRIIDLLKMWLQGHDPERASEFPGTTGGVAAMLTVVRTLALPYAERPGYREEWRP